MKHAYEIETDLLLESLNGLEEAMVIYDAEGRLRFCNAMFQELYDYKDEDVRPGTHYTDLGRIDLERGNVVVGDEFGGGEAYLARKAAYRETLSGSFIVQMKDGRWIKTTDRRLPNGGFVSVQTDVTDLKRVEKALQERNEALEIANRAKTLFFASMSHELRTPLNAIIGFADLIHNEVFGDIGNDRYRTYVGDIHRSGRLLLELINNVLDFSSLESSARRIEVAPVTLGPVIEDCMAITKIHAGSRQISIEWGEGLWPCRLMAEEQALKQVVLNLLSNAIKYSEPGGRIDVGCEHRMELGETHVMIRDEGRGMTPAQIKAVGEPFVVRQGRTSRREQSSGLGLAISSRLVESMGGRMEFHSEIGSGTLVVVALPAIDPKRA